MKLDAGALAGLHQFAAALRTPMEVAEGVQAVLGLRPRQRDFPAAVHAVDTALGADVSLSRLRAGTYLRRSAVPPWVADVPEAVRPQHGPLTPEQAAESLLPIAELPPELATHVLNAAYEDVGETRVTVAEEPLQETRLVIPWHHYQCGTMMLRQRDRRLLDLPATLTMLTLEAPRGERLPVWANSQTSLLYGLLAWYYETLPPSGGIVTLRRDDRPDVLTIEHSGELDSAARIGEERLGHLLHLRDRLQRRPAALAETVAAVLQGQARGFTFDQLWFQLNIVRRTTRHQLASALVLAGQLQQAESGRWRAV